jgi:hypothetical protein
MDSGTTPHACFRVDSARFAKGEQSLPQKLVDHLKGYVASVQLKKPPFVGSWIINVQVGNTSAYSIHLGPSKYKEDEWVLLVGSLRPWSLRDTIRRRGLVEYSAELLELCRAIHRLISIAPGFTDARWYFQGFRNQGSAVATPDELPWGSLPLHEK